VIDGRTASRPDTLTILVTNLDRGGAETQAVRLALGLRSRGWRVRMVSLLSPRDFVARLNDADIPVVALHLNGIPSLPGALYRLWRELRQHRPEVLATFTYHANVSGKVIGRLAGVPRVIASIRSEFFGGRLRDRLESLTGRLATATITNSRHVGERLVERGVVDARKLAVVTNAVAPAVAITPTERSELRREMGAVDDGLLWLAVGRFETAKDYPNLLRAFARLVDERPRSRLAIIGYGALDKVVRAGVAEEGLDEQVRVLGRRDDATRYLEACDAYVLSSAWEGLPNTVLEAMAAAQPVVATVVGGVKDLLDDGKAGLLAPPRDPVALADAMVRLDALGSEQRDVMGRRGLEIATARHGVQATLNRWESVLRDEGGVGHV